MERDLIPFLIHENDDFNLSQMVLKDPVLPMILSGMTMNFILYEKDYGLAIARLCIVVSFSNERYEVIVLNSNKRHSQK